MATLTESLSLSAMVRLADRLDLSDSFAVVAMSFPRLEHRLARLARLLGGELLGIYRDGDDHVCDLRWTFATDEEAVEFRLRWL